MIDDALRLTIDVLFDTKYTFHSNNHNNGNNENILEHKDFKDNKDNKDVKDNKEILEYKSPFPVKNFSDAENMW